MKVYELSDEVLADEVLADDVLATDAAKTLKLRLQKMRPEKRKAFMRKFSPKNASKLMRSIRSYNKMKSLKKGTTKKMPLLDEVTLAGFAGMDNEDTGIYGKRFAKKRASKIQKKAQKAAAKNPDSNKAKRLTTKAKIKTAKASGDKGGLKAAKGERRERIKDNAKKVGKVLNKVNPVLATGRGAFLGMVALNLRGLATKMSQTIDMGKFAEIKKKWESLGGSEKKLKDAINRGKGKKPLLGSKGLKGYEDIYDELNDEIFEAQNEYGGIYAGVGATVSAAAAAPVLIAIIPLLKKLFPGDKSLDETEEGVTSEDGKKKSRKFLDKAKDFFSGKGNSKASQTIGAVLGAAGGAAVDAIEERIQTNVSGEPSEDAEDGKGSNTMLYLGLGGLSLAGLGYLATRKKSKSQ
jgi:hypothetical protein